MHITRLAVAVALLGPWLCGAASAADTLKATIDRLGGQPCRVGNLTCVSVEVPVDYRANTGPTIKIEYAVSFASGESKGILFYVVGGPGGSGISVADDYLAAFDARLTENMDIVFFDQRGVGLSNHIQPCQADRTLDPGVTLSEAALTAYHRETLAKCLGLWRSAGVAAGATRSGTT